MFLHEVTLSNVLSFGSETTLGMKPLNVLIGPNGCGKSNFIEALGLLHAAPTLHVVHLLGGTLESGFFLNADVAPSLPCLEEDPARRQAAQVSKVGNAVACARKPGEEARGHHEQRKHSGLNRQNAPDVDLFAGPVPGEAEHDAEDCAGRADHGAERRNRKEDHGNGRRRPSPPRSAPVD